MTTTRTPSEPTTPPAYRQLLQRAFAMGREDGTFAAAFEPDGTGDPVGRVCRGRAPQSFARRLWGDRSGNPPAGLELCAPEWYATGFAEGLASSGPSGPGRDGPPISFPPAPVRRTQHQPTGTK